jgi:hypothetical protein
MWTPHALLLLLLLLLLVLLSSQLHHPLKLLPAYPNSCLA